ncbi:kinase-like domain-containing protein [Aspergillus carlsbadensis]|nr:kinase-like domain-containing protein [Aspergillus carlsbadensis]
MQLATRSTTRKISRLRLFSSLRRKPLPPPPPGLLLRQDEPVDEEICPGYDSKRFYPVKPGEVLADRYQILAKVGWGTSSTVWLARDMRGDESEPENAVALKITNTSKSSAAKDELDIEAHIAATDPSHRGYPLFRTSLDSFEADGPHGSHLCLAYEPMREPLWLFQRRFTDRRIPLPIVKAYILFLLAGLDYLHTACRVVHTDLKLENIMVTFEDAAVFSDFINTQFEQPMHYKIDSTGRPDYRRHNDFGPLRKPDHYRAPEVILGCGWSASADIWNVGVLIWDIMQGQELFRQIYDKQGRYDAKAHLAEMIALLGPPPPRLITRAYSAAAYKWPQPVRKGDGSICENFEQYFGGPFFNTEGHFLYDNLIPDRTLEDTTPSSLGGSDRDNFLSFVKMMLAWIPEDRKTAGELLKHPFLRLQ